MSVLLLLLAAATAPARAQSASIYQRQLSPTQRPPIGLPQANWIGIPQPPPREIHLHDKVTVRVSEKSQMLSQGNVQRRRNGLYDVILKDWILLKSLTEIKPSPQSEGDPRVQGELNEQYRVQADMRTRELLEFNIAARVADIRPNGNLVLEAHHEIRINDEIWDVSLTGICRAEDIAPDNMVLSEDILDLRIDKRERGQVRESYRRGWFLRWFDEFKPF